MTPEEPLMAERLCADCEFSYDGGDICTKRLRRLCTRAWHAGAALEREECAAIANRKMVAATEAEPMVEPPSEAIRARHFAIAAGQIEEAICARDKTA